MTSRAFLLVLCLFVTGAGPASAEIYRWTDAQGVEHFGDRIEDVPEVHRQDVTRDLRSAERVAPPPPPGARAAAEPPADGPRPDATAAEWAGPLLALGAAGLLAAALASFALWLVTAAVGLRLACRLVGEEVPAFARACGVSAVQMVAGLALGLVLAGIALVGLVDATALAFQGVQILATFLVNAGVVATMLGIGFGRALVVTLVALLVTMAFWLLVGLALAVGLGALAAGQAG